MVAKSAGLASDGNSDEPRADIVVKTDWSTVENWADVVAHFGQLDIATEVFGDGSELVEKESLIGRQMVILEWRVVTDKDTLRDYVNVLAMLRENSKKIRFNDGSTGVMKQCLEYEAKYGRNGGIVTNGLRVSEYIAELPDGTRSPAKTYYFS